MRQFHKPGYEGQQGMESYEIMNINSSEKKQFNRIMVMLIWYSLLMSYELYELLEHVYVGPALISTVLGINQNQNNGDFSTCICETKRCIQLSGRIKTAFYLFMLVIIW